MRGREIIKRLRPLFTSSCVLIPGNDLEAKEQNQNWICLLETRDGITQVPAMLLETGSLGSSQQGPEAAIQEHMHTKGRGQGCASWCSQASGEPQPTLSPPTPPGLF